MVANPDVARSGFHTTVGEQSRSHTMGVGPSLNLTVTYKAGEGSSTK